METANVYEVVGSNSGVVYWMDIFHIDLLLKLYCWFGKTENKQKEPRVCPFLKKHKAFILAVSASILKLISHVANLVVHFLLLHKVIHGQVIQVVLKDDYHGVAN